MLPVVDLLVQLETIVKLVHLDLIWVIPGEDLSEDPSI
jgi:hypothetical protein